MLTTERLLADDLSGPEAVTRRLAIAALGGDDPLAGGDVDVDVDADVDVELLLAPASVLPLLPPPLPPLAAQADETVSRAGDGADPRPGGQQSTSPRLGDNDEHDRARAAAAARDARPRRRPLAARLSDAMRGDPTAFAGVAIVVLVATALLAAAGRAGSDGGATPTAAGSRAVASSTTAAGGDASTSTTTAGGSVSTATTAAGAGASATSTTTASPPATVTPVDPRAAVSSFLAALADNTHSSAGVDALLAALNPAVTDRYGAERCRSFLLSSVDPTAAFEVISVSAPAPYDYASDGQSTIVPDTLTVQVHHTQRGTVADQAVHVARRADGSLSWFTRCSTG